MKRIVNYINEKLRVTSKSFYTCQPNTKDELQEIIIKRIKEDGNDCDLNDIDVSKITDMSCLFNANTDWNSGNKIFKYFNGDISQWNVSNVTNMCGIFNWCDKFNCDISLWDVSNVEDMEHMFNYCGHFNCDISRWNVSNVENMYAMFQFCYEFNCDLSRWHVSNVNNMKWMFRRCTNFKQNLDMWNVSNVKNMDDAFIGCPTKPKWYNGY